MTERVWWLGLLFASCTGMVIVGCSSNSDAKGTTANGGSTAQGGATAQAGATAHGGRAASSGGATASSGATSTAGASAAGGATASGGSGACTPDLTCMPVAPNTGDPYADCVTRVNQFRACDCKAPLTQDKDGQACADQQAAYDAMKNSAHAGFGANICTPQFFAQNECPGWGSQQDTIDGCAQQMYDEGPGPTGCANDDTCYSAHGHFINMTGNYKMVTCGFAKDADGKEWTVQNFR